LGFGPAYWSVYGGLLEVSDTYAVQGARSARLTSDTSSTKWAHQVVSIQGGAFYEFAAHAMIPEGVAGTVFLRVSWYATEDGGGRALSSVDSMDRLTTQGPGFTRLTTGTVIAPEAARSARLRLMLTPVSGFPAAAYFDAVAFHPAEPDEYTWLDLEGTTGGSSRRSGRQSEVAGISAAGRVDPNGLPASPHSVKINEVAFNPPVERDEVSHEWVEIYNAGPEPVDLAGWVLADNTQGTPLPPRTLAPGEFLVIAASERMRDLRPDLPFVLVALDGKIGNGLANSGDRVLLVDADSRLVDAMSYGRDDTVFAVPPTPAGHASLERRPFGYDTDEAEDFVINRRPTPGFGLTDERRAVEAVGGRGMSRIPGLIGYRLPEQTAMPPFIGYLAGAAILSPAITFAFTRIWGSRHG
jgi:hypothetical protein